ncbi:MAG: hypothetical protein ACXWC4_04215 [Telluria sp.]
MNKLKSITTWAALAAAVLLAGCGGGSNVAVQHSQQAGEVSTGGGSSTPVTADFVKVAQQESCADIKNRLYLIDGKEVFWDRAGNCPDNAYVQRLYGANPQTVLCEMSDTLAGPKTFCANDSMRALFELLQRGADQPNLGLDAQHKVEPILFLPKSGTAIPFQTLVKDGHTGVSQQRDVVIRDQAAFDKLWAEHVSDRSPTPPAPAVNFTSQMVIGVFAADVVTCGNMGIVGVRSQDGKMVVDIERRAPAPTVACPAVIVTPMQMVTVGRNDAPVEFVRHDVCCRHWPWTAPTCRACMTRATSSSRIRPHGPRCGSSMPARGVRCRRSISAPRWWSAYSSAWAATVAAAPASTV